MWYIIKRESDNKYLSELTLTHYDDVVWSDEIQEARKLRQNLCDAFTRKFKNDVFLIIEVEQ
jgi:hypothetical protein